MSFIKILNDRFTGALYDENNFFRPTEIGTMGSDESTDTQYGPVCTYHMTASFKVRMGQIKAQDITVTNTSYNYEWDGYSLDDFKEEWPPCKF